jgi:hypothetical protein
MLISLQQSFYCNLQWHCCLASTSVERSSCQPADLVCIHADGRRALGPRHPWEEMQTDPSVFQPPDEGELPAYMVDSNPLEVNRQTMESDGGAAVPWSGPEINHQKLTESWMARAQQQHARKAQGWGGGAEVRFLNHCPQVRAACLACTVLLLPLRLLPGVDTAQMT